MGRFFVSVQPGHEDALFREIRNFWPQMIDLDGQPTKQPVAEPLKTAGGLQLEVPDHMGYQINFFSKLAGRVLLRLTSFEARYFDQLERNLEKVDLAKVLDLDFLKKQLNVKVEHHKSRLNNEKNILEAVQNVFSKKGIKISAEASQTLYIRIEKDKVTISLDTTGEHLHRRGYSTFRGEAPLRETLAGYMIFKLFETIGSEAAVQIFDPFAGSGTLLFEAMSAHRPNLERDYSWLHFKTAPKLFKSPTWKKNYRGYSTVPAVSGFAVDKDEKSIASIQKNTEDFKRTFQFEKIPLTSELADSANIDLKPFKNADQLLWIVTNPPYGMRLADDGAKKILEKLAEDADGLLVIHPEKWKFSIKNLTQKSTEVFNNQGLKLTLSVFTKNQ
ncbi:MAG: hypothetical protein K0R29_2261 [Pseudobdellovibrio sp.]|jgi:putative N6-adenine-specific DNA methylase|nr:hypothetical protein [Pseudobdellovibrio sp.]